MRAPSHVSDIDSDIDTNDIAYSSERYKLEESFTCENSFEDEDWGSEYYRSTNGRKKCKNSLNSELLSNKQKQGMHQTSRSPKGAVFMDYDEEGSQNMEAANNSKNSHFKLGEADSLEFKSVIKNAALALLAHREQSQKELFSKLKRKFAEPDLVQQVIDELAQSGLQSDERFVESFLRARKSAGKGPVLIKQELKQKGISEYLIAAYVYDNDEEWRELAERVYLKKFGDEEVADMREKGKRMRFMASRGFASDIVYDLVGG